jgi:hypothetical protein
MLLRALLLIKECSAFFMGASSCVWQLKYKPKCRNFVAISYFSRHGESFGSNYHANLFTRIYL